MVPQNSKNRGKAQNSRNSDNHRKQNSNRNERNRSNTQGGANRSNTQESANRSNSAHRSPKITKFRRYNNVNIGIALLVLVLLYAFVIFVKYLGTEHIVRYEVVEGSLAISSNYRGVVIRDEVVHDNPYPGYVNYLAREGQRVAVGDLVYTVDETGSLSSILEAQSMGENILSDRELSEFRSDIINFVHGFDAQNFTGAYDFKYSLKNTVLKLANTKLMNSIDDISADGVAMKGIQYCYSDRTGIISYWLDGYENLIASQVNADIFDMKKYEKNMLLSNELRATGEEVYKISTNENWSLVFPVDEAFGQELLSDGYVKVRFLKNQYESWGKVGLLNNPDGTYLKLDFNNSMMTFASERFLDIQLVLTEDPGLKIPLSAISEKEFYLIEDKYVYKDEEGKHNIVLQTFDDNNNRITTTKTLNVTDYDETNGYYYVDDALLSAGDVLFTQNKESMETYVVKIKGTLLGVYNVNKGFADFKPISILYQNDEYAIIRSHSAYGLRVYDYIALDAKSVKDDQFVH